MLTRCPYCGARNRDMIYHVRPGLGYSSKPFNGCNKRCRHPWHEEYDDAD